LIIAGSRHDQSSGRQFGAWIKTSADPLGEHANGFV
jgi:hypothetical protein